MSYIISNDGDLLAKTEESLKSGERVLCSDCKMDGNQLLNPIFAKVSNAKKWDKLWDGETGAILNFAELLDATGIYKRYFLTFSNNHYD